MRELTIRLAVEDFLDYGFPYPGELFWGYRNDWLDAATMIGVVEGLSARNIPLCPAEEAMALLLKDEVNQVGDLVNGLSDYENESSRSVWCYYIASHLDASVGDAKTKFQLLDVAWADMEYPDELYRVLFPRDHHPAHVYMDMGWDALNHFMAEWRRLLVTRDPGERLGAGTAV